MVTISPALGTGHRSSSKSYAGAPVKEQKCYLANDGNNKAIIKCLKSSYGWRITAETNLIKTNDGWVYPLEEQTTNESKAGDIFQPLFLFILSMLALGLLFKFIFIFMDRNHKQH